QGVKLQITRVSHAAGKIALDAGFEFAPVAVGHGLGVLHVERLSGKVRRWRAVLVFMVHECFAGRERNEAAITANAERIEILRARDDKNQSFVPGSSRNSNLGPFALSVASAARRVETHRPFDFAPLALRSGRTDSTSLPLFLHGALQHPRRDP